MIAIMAVLHDLWDAEGLDRPLAAGAVLFRAGDPVRQIYRVEVGTMILQRPLPQGAALILQRTGPSGLLAEASLFASAYHCDAVAAGPVRLRGLPVDRVRAALLAHPARALAFAGQLATEVQGLRARAEILSLRTVAERVEAWLALHDGALPARGHLRGVADEIAVTPEALYRELARRRDAARG